MKKYWLATFFLSLACMATAQKSHPNEAQIMGFRILDGEKDHFLGIGYYYNFNQRNAIGARISYHTEKKSEFYQRQTRYFEISHRWRFQKMDKKISWSLSTGPWMQIFTSQTTGVSSGDNRWNTIGVMNTAGLHYHITPRLNAGATGLLMLEVFSWERGVDPAFYPLVTPGIGLQLAYAW